ncbi:WAT1-related protein [Tripterygium wilfordii]|uniref:WAT1-related protein n=1 Tax=Tripterygium wilfordii TaxID=458696 RepID=A0A7J7CJE8_TRIWF|nr:WAT1-related protein At3g28050-like [Tripterygium wilfordii]KAF5734180.1 WAT1-related protein [Tripterygium wilfordii]
MGFKSWLMAALPFASMVILEGLDVGLTTLSKAAMAKGMSHYVFVVYSNALATLLLLPSSFVFNRKAIPPLTYSILFKFFLLSLFGITIMQNCVMTAVNYSSPALGSAISQLVPAFTFLLAVIFRMEKLDLGSSKSQIKIISTIVSISGALIVILYKGAPIISLDVQSQQEPLPSILLAKMNNWVLGGLLFAAAGLSLSIWTTYQAVVVKEYPSQTTLLTFYCFFGTIQCAIVSLIAERNPNTWKLRHNIEYISVIYSAVFGTAVTSNVITWCIRKKGPVFVAMFKPVGIAIAAFLGVIFLGETLHVGSIIGAIIIVFGFYGVVWSQSKEEEESRILVLEGSRLASQRVPILENRTDV